MPNRAPNLKDNTPPKLMNRGSFSIKNRKKDKNLKLRTTSLINRFRSLSNNIIEEIEKLDKADIENLEYSKDYLKIKKMMDDMANIKKNGLF